MATLRDKYGAGSQLADAASLAFNPSNDGQIVKQFMLQDVLKLEIA